MEKLQDEKEHEIRVQLKPDIKNKIIHRILFQTI